MFKVFFIHNKFNHAVLLLRLFIISAVIGILTTVCFAVNVSLPMLPKDYGEKVVRIPMLEQPSMTLEATIFKPSGNGQFPVLVVNHGKQTNPDASAQKRFRPLTVVREFLLRGYVVVAPNRRGFAGSDGRYILNDCDVAADGLRQADDVHSTVAYMLGQHYVDARRILIAGGSQGGLISIAYGTHPDAGVKGLINFNGGSRQVKCEHWGQNIVNAFAGYGRSCRLPSLWIYGQNDRFWSPELIQSMFNSYRLAGGQAEFADIGTFKNDSHEIEGDPDGTAIWWPAVEAFLKELGFPAKVFYRSPEEILPASRFAAIDEADAVPYLDFNGRKGYRTFLTHGNPRVFAISDQGKWSSAVGGDDPLGRAVTGCQKQSKHPCRPYAVNDDVVWTKAASSSQFASVESSKPPVSFPARGSGYASIDDIQAVPYINDRGRKIYREFLDHPAPRAFVVVKTGAFVTSYGGNDPLSSAMRSCREHFQDACEPYAVNDTVVWVRR